ncbi:hypothetical protein BO224_05300 [Erysipelotrichaceae bacterium NYU-BL-E8]|uniref:Uncharacterized protein n=1 Tax=Ileibacterium valens TaxID=1862668 RepID=A0A1U7NG48_9FIRM|nr:hypothetical protein BO222_06215 [Ileibacterium valens]OLU40349.1 hypothetical protein BM735_05725 [Erysipelotrichaceae bacterium NYU-BL-F16]OLU40574.1 hypothetical protein BO224_05300 [Erysipelotrichaceae bacterium NYU-BL-E8]
MFRFFALMFRFLSSFTDNKAIYIDAKMQYLKTRRKNQSFEYLQSRSNQQRKEKLAKIKMSL